MAMQRGRGRRDAVTEEEIAAFCEAQHQFGNDNNRIAAFLAGREQLSNHARRIYGGAYRAYVNRLRVVRRHIQQRAVQDGRLPPDPNRRDDRFAYNLEELENPRELMDRINNAAEQEAADPLANPPEENAEGPQPDNQADGDQAREADQHDQADVNGENPDDQLPRGGLRQLQIQNNLLLRRILHRIEARQDLQDRLTTLLINRLEGQNQE